MKNLWSWSFELLKWSFGFCAFHDTRDQSEVRQIREQHPHVGLTATLSNFVVEESLVEQANAAQNFIRQRHIRYWIFSPKPAGLAENVREIGVTICQFGNVWEWRASVPYRVHNSKDNSYVLGASASLEDAKKDSNNWIVDFINRSNGGENR